MALSDIDFLIEKEDLSAGHIADHKNIVRGLKTIKQELENRLSQVTLDSIYAPIGAAGSLAWNDITGKPTTYDPSTHTHAISEVSGLQSELNAKALSTHSHAISDVSGLQSAINAKANTTHTHNVSDINATGTASATTYLRGDGTWVAISTSGSVAWADITNKPTTFTPSSHTHNTSEINGLDTALSAKAPLASPTFTGTVSGISKSMVGLANVDNTSDSAKPISSATQTALDAKAASSHTHAYSSLSGIPTTFTPSSHTHSQADISNLSTSLAAKVDNASGQTLTLWKGTTAQYNAIATKDSNTVYVVT